MKNVLLMSCVAVATLFSLYNFYNNKYILERLNNLLNEVNNLKKIEDFKNKNEKNEDDNENKNKNKGGHLGYNYSGSRPSNEITNNSETEKKNEDSIELAEEEVEMLQNEIDNIDKLIEESSNESSDDSLTPNPDTFSLEENKPINNAIIDLVNEENKKNNSSEFEDLINTDKNSELNNYFIQPSGNVDVNQQLLDIVNNMKNTEYDESDEVIVNQFDQNSDDESSNTNEEDEEDEEENEEEEKKKRKKMKRKKR